MPYITSFLFFMALFLNSTSSLFATEDLQNVTTKSAVTFNTLCAKCHEGECSGRLSFDTGSEAASNHILRYTGETDISKTETKEFFTLLNYMKSKCSLWMPEDEQWKTEELSHFALPSAKAYFIPLGVLKKGEYVLEIETDDAVHYKLELLSEKFDYLLDISVCPDEDTEELRFSVDEALHTFLRVQSRSVFEITELKIIEEK